MSIDRRYYDYNRHGRQVDIVEAMANEFADKLLMPEDMFREAIKSEKNIGKLAEMFEVPSSAVRRRALSLGYNIKRKNQ
jgi:Zn-dependent peptidase ImmA (M78 family)